jgi:hypothetical protein
MNKELKGSGRGLIYVISWNLPGETEKIYENHQDIRGLDRDLSQTPSEYPSRALPLH